MPALTEFLQDYTSYLAIGMSLLTCFEFFKSRSRWLVIIAVAGILFFAVFLHNSVFNVISSLAEGISVYKHTLDQNTRRINFRKAGITLGVPLVILLIIRFIPPLWGMVQTAHFIFTPTLLAIVGLLIPSIFMGIIVGIWTRSEINGSKDPFMVRLIGGFFILVWVGLWGIIENGFWLIGPVLLLLAMYIVAAIVTLFARWLIWRMMRFFRARE